MDWVINFCDFFLAGSATWKKHREDVTFDKIAILQRSVQGLLNEFLAIVVTVLGAGNSRYDCGQSIVSPISTRFQQKTFLLLNDTLS